MNKILNKTNIEFMDEYFKKNDKGKYILDCNTPLPDFADINDSDEIRKQKKNKFIKQMKDYEGK